MKIKLAKFLLGFALVVFGLAIGSGMDYLDMQQFEARLDKTISSTSVTNPAVIRQFLKSHNVSSDLSDAIMLQFSGADFYYKAQLQNIRVSVSQKKSQASKKHEAVSSTVGVCEFVVFFGDS